MPPKWGAGLISKYIVYDFGEVYGGEVELITFIYKCVGFVFVVKHIPHGDLRRGAL